MRRLQAAARSSGARGFPGGGGGVPKGLGFGLGGAVLLGGGFFLLQNSLFNVDGGHRAIKYRRISGVSKEIYSEGELPPDCVCGSTGNSRQRAVMNHLGCRSARD